mgnify:CR=1 FL=1
MAEVIHRPCPMQELQRFERDWAADQKLFQALVIKGADARGLFAIAWMAGHKAALEERT